jgi:inosine/xanthosine triphosphate pyrophosphatase family protein
MEAALSAMTKIFFITSSQTKLMNARYLARNMDVEIVPQPNYGIAYNEPRDVDRMSLLRESFFDALHRWSKSVNSKNHFFFIEDTSVIIPALSDENNEVPGLDIKFWMQGMDFPTLDSLLKQIGKGRSAIVRSDVVLYLPPDLQRSEPDGSRYKVFTHLTEGSITEQSVAVKTNPLFPWLDNTSFNKWFVPKGETTVLSKLPITKADKHDIRKGSVGAMLNFLESKHIIGQRRSTSTWAKESLLPMGWPKLVILCGLPCSGKTTLGTFLSEQCGYLHLEASDFMRMAYQRRNKEDSTLGLDSFATKALKSNPGIVVEEILKNLERSSEPLPAITGFRDPK